MKSDSSSHEGIHYRIIGSGPPLVMLHGLVGSKEDWIDSGYVDGLKDTHQLILIDFRGLGENKKSYDPEFYSLNYLADDVQSIIDDLGIQQYGLLGYSMGGVIAHWISKKYPGSIRSMVSLDGIIIPDLVNIYKYWSENIKDMIEDFASDPRNTKVQRSRIINNDPRVIQALSLGLSQSISNNLSEFLSMPDQDYPYLVIVSNWDDQDLNIDEYINWAKSFTTFKKYQDFDHADFIYRSSIVISDLKSFYETII